MTDVQTTALATTLTHSLTTQKYTVLLQSGTRTDVRLPTSSQNFKGHTQWQHPPHTQGGAPGLAHSSSSIAIPTQT